MALADAANLVINLGLNDNVSAGLKGIQSGVSGLDQSFGRSQAAVGKFGANIVKVAAVGTGAVVAGLTVAVREAANFESQLNIINTVAQVSQDELTGIGDSMREMARTSGTSLEELTAAYYDLVSAGVDAADAQDVLADANKLAIGGLATTGEAVDLLTTAMNSYGLTAEEVSDATDYFAQSIAAGKVTAAELAQSFSQVAPLAAASGIEIEELAAGYAQLTASGVPAAEASTQMRAAIVALQKPTADMEKLQKKLNINFAEVAEEQGLAAAYQLLAEEADKAGIPMVSLTGRVEAAGYALAVSGENAEGYNQNLEDVKTSTEGAGVAADQMAERQKGLNFALDRLKATGKDLAIMFGTEMLPSVTRITEAIGRLIDKNWGKLEQFARKLGDALDSTFTDKKIEDGIGNLSRKLGTLLDAVNKKDIGKDLEGFLGFVRDLPWEAIGSGMQVFGDASKKAVDIFRSLPPGVQSALITFLAANKLMGGLPGAVLKDLGGFIFKSLTTINAGNVTVNAATASGPGGAGAGGGSKLGQVVASVSVAGIAAVAIDQLGQEQAQALRETPLTTDAAKFMNSSGFGELFRWAGRSPLVDLGQNILGPGFRDVFNGLEQFANSSVGYDQKLLPRRSLPDRFRHK